MALTLASVVFGLSALNDYFFSYRCFPPTRVARLKIAEVRYAFTQYQIAEAACPPTRDDLIDGKYISARQLVDPWGTSIAYWCRGEDVEIRSAGPDKLFNTADDISNEPRD